MKPISLDARYSNDLFKAWAQSEYLELSFKRLMRRSSEARIEVLHSDVYTQDFSPLRLELQRMVYDKKPTRPFTDEEQKQIDEASVKFIRIAQEYEQLQNRLRPTSAPTLAPTQDPYIKTSDTVYLRSCSIPSADKSNKVYRSFNDDLAVMAPSWVAGATKDTVATYKIAHENGQDYVSTGSVVHIESTEADYSMYCSAAFNVAFWKGVSPDVPWTGNNDRNWLIRKRDTASASDPRIKFGEEVVISTQKEDYAIQVNGYQAGYKGLHYVACKPGYGGDLEKKYGPGSTQCFKFERA